MAGDARRQVGHHLREAGAVERLRRLPVEDQVLGRRAEGPPVLALEVERPEAALLRGLAGVDTEADHTQPDADREERQDRVPAPDRVDDAVLPPARAHEARLVDAGIPAERTLAHAPPRADSRSLPRKSSRNTPSTRMEYRKNGLASTPVIVLVVEPVGAAGHRGLRSRFLVPEKEPLVALRAERDEVIRRALLGRIAVVMHGAVVVGLEPHDRAPADRDEREAFDPSDGLREEGPRLPGEGLAFGAALLAPPAVGHELDVDLPREVDAELVLQPEHLPARERMLALLADLQLPATARIEQPPGAEASPRPQSVSKSASLIA